MKIKHVRALLAFMAGMVHLFTIILFTLGHWIMGIIGFLFGCILFLYAWRRFIVRK